ncbi:MAG: hypothetical protein WCT07_00080 [Candidatus Paceibacterota bacterium]|jgi:uncharacterized protein with PQ loop repeat
MPTELPHNHWIDKLALLNGIISALSLYPQLYILITSKVENEHLSPVSFGLILLNSVIWFLYGIHRKIAPLVISSFFNLVASSAILILIY